jgi:hypothetical protein
MKFWKEKWNLANFKFENEYEELWKRVELQREFRLVPMLNL